MVIAGKKYGIEVGQTAAQRKKELLKAVAEGKQLVLGEYSELKVLLAAEYQPPIDPAWLMIPIHQLADSSFLTRQGHELVPMMGAPYPEPEELSVVTLKPGQYFQSSNGVQIQNKGHSEIVVPAGLILEAQESKKNIVLAEGEIGVLPPTHVVIDEDDFAPVPKDSYPDPDKQLQLLPELAAQEEYKAVQQGLIDGLSKSGWTVARSSSKLDGPAIVDAAMDLTEAMEKQASEPASVLMHPSVHADILKEVVGAAQASTAKYLANGFWDPFDSFEKRLESISVAISQSTAYASGSLNSVLLAASNIILAMLDFGYLDSAIEGELPKRLKPYLATGCGVVSVFTKASDIESYHGARCYGVDLDGGPVIDRLLVYVRRPTKALKAGIMHSTLEVIPKQDPMKWDPYKMELLG
jgi:hypothetical protein